MNSAEGRDRKVTSFDVARRAGVSRAAVSRTFTPDASVSLEMREKVQKAAKELGYRVNYLARSLTNQRSDLVGVVAAGMDNPFRAQQIDEIARALLRRNFRPILLPTDSDRSPTHVIDELLHYSVSGVLVTSDAPPTSLCEECAAYGVPIVLINKGDEIPTVDRVISDNEAAGKLAADTLIEAGSKSPAVMGATKVSYTARGRVDAFLAACRAASIEPRIVPIPLNDYDSGFEGAGRLVGSGIDGLFCINDYTACGVVDRIRTDTVVRLPGRVRIVGHDDIPQARWAAYNLTTIRQPCDVQAQKAIDFLTSRMAQADLPARVEFTPVSLVRRTTA